MLRKCLLSGQTERTFCKLPAFDPLELQYSALLKGFFSIPAGPREEGALLSPKAKPEGVTARMPKASRRSKRVSLRVPVVIYGQNRSAGAFHEETSTNLVSAHGGLVALTTRVGIGETVLVVNKTTQEEQECRVVSVHSLQGPKRKVGLALLRSAPNFWGLNFPFSS